MKTLKKTNSMNKKANTSNAGKIKSINKKSKTTIKKKKKIEDRSAGKRDQKIPLSTSEVKFDVESLNKVYRVLIAKPGLDGHDRGAKVVARGLRDEGFEVIYTGLHQTPEMVVQAALQEDVDMIGLSILSGAHLPLVKAILDLMKMKKLKKPVFVGGIIPDDDSLRLKKMGVSSVFGPGSTIAEISKEVRRQIEKM